MILARFRNALFRKSFAREPEFEGAVHRRTIHHASGWARDRTNAAAKVRVEAVIITSDGERVIGRAVADDYYGFLSLQSFNDVWHGFQLIYDAPLSDDECDSVVIRPAGSQFQLEFSAPPEVPVNSALSVARSAGPVFLGYIDGISLEHVSGWVLDVNDVGARVEFEAVVMLDGDARVIASGTAELFYPPLQSSGYGDAKYGFSVRFPSQLTTGARDNLTIRPVGHQFSLPRGLCFQGYVDELTTTHVMGWVHDRFRPEQKLRIEAVINTPDGERDLGHGIADIFHAGLALGAPHDAEHGFAVNFVPKLTPEQLGSVRVRLTANDFTLPAAPTVAMPSRQPELDMIN